MKKIAFIFITIITVSCTVDYPPTVVNTTEKKINWAGNFSIVTTIVAPGETINLETNIEGATLTTNKGTISGKVFTAPMTQGKVQLKATNPSNPNDFVGKVVYVSQYKPLFEDMKKGGYVLSFRHADASDGSDTFGTFASEWWKSCSNTLARQLSPSAIPQCNEIGECFKLYEYKINKIISSEFCRSIKTAELFNLNNVPVEINKDITYFAYDEANRYTKQIELINAQPINNKNTLMIGHVAYPSTPTPLYLGTLGWGDAAVFKLNQGAPSTYVTTIDDVILRAMLTN